MTSQETHVLSLSIERAGRTSKYQVHSGVVLIGSGSHCDVRLTPEDAAPEQLRFELRGAELYAESLAPGRDCTRDERPFVQGILDTGTRLQLGQTSLQVDIAAVSGAKMRAAASGSTSLITRIVGFAAIALGLYYVLQTEEPISLLDQAVQHPALFGVATAKCSDGSGDELAFRAQRLLRGAQLQRERAPFHPSDGIAAVAGYEEASACFQRLDMTNDAKAADRSAAALRRTLSDEFHVRHVRLERLLKIKKYDAAQREVRVLQDFAAHQNGPYAQWLSAVQRELNTRFASAQQKS